MRHPVTGRFMAGDCERDCIEHCAGLCGVSEPAPVRRITPERYHSDPADRALADQVMDRLGLDPRSVFEIVVAETGVEVGTYVRDACGAVLVNGRDVVREWRTIGGSS